MKTNLKTFPEWKCGFGGGDDCLVCQFNEWKKAFTKELKERLERYGTGVTITVEEILGE